MRTVVIISGSGSNLQAFIDEVDAGRSSLELQLVVSNRPQAYGLERAAKAGIKTAVVDHTKYDSRADFDSALQATIDAANPELVILAGFMRILTEEFVNHYTGRLINIHPSLLPKFTGTNTHQRVLDAQEEWHGASIHYVIPELDAGPVILRGRLKVKADDTADSLQQRVHKIEHKIYPLAADWIAQRRLTIKNDEVLLDGEQSALQLQTFEA